ncbi:unnamed protein product [Protopolystoma xenopodis]|uniref:Uncharacterized protein n=1 Tax=Protopolystoma xenopodis TaxID=117903 RepID=A0A448X4B4_9PLAT|nr:unnamed protein product [Protopolystoma xenopodis]
MFSFLIAKATLPKLNWMSFIAPCLLTYPTSTYAFPFFSPSHLRWLDHRIGYDCAHPASKSKSKCLNEIVRTRRTCLEPVQNNETSSQSSTWLNNYDPPPQLPPSCSSTFTAIHLYYNQSATYT